jgi:hypothetical protein
VGVLDVTLVECGCVGCVVDGNKAVEEEYSVTAPSGGSIDFDEMLRQAKKKIKK